MQFFAGMVVALILMTHSCAKVVQYQTDVSFPTNVHFIKDISYVDEYKPKVVGAEVIRVPNLVKKCPNGKKPDRTGRCRLIWM